VSVLRGTRVGRGADYEADASRRAAVADMARKADEALKKTLGDGATPAD